MPPTKPPSKADVDGAHGLAEPHPDATRRARRSFVLRRLHSLSGVLPVGAFLIAHLWTNASALGGQPAFDATVKRIHHLPFLPAIELFGILLPLAFHAGYGVKLALEGRPNVARYPYGSNWTYTMQRVTGVVALLFIVYHLGELRLAKLLGTLRPEAFYPTLSLRLSSTALGVPWLAIGYLVGIGASVLHFTSGLTTFVLSWGISGSRESQRRLGVAFSAVGVLLFALGATTAIYFATGLPSFRGDRPHSSDSIEQRAVVDPALSGPSFSRRHDNVPVSP